MYRRTITIEIDFDKEHQGQTSQVYHFTLDLFDLRSNMIKSSAERRGHQVKPPHVKISFDDILLQPSLNEEKE